MATTHTTLAAGRWQEFSLSEQMGNIGSEASRALKWQEKDEKLYSGAIERALELFDLTLDDPRWRRGGRLREIARAREVFVDAVFGGTAYGSTLKDLLPYFDHFAFSARSRF